MPTLFKRSNEIYYALFTNGNGSRKWKSMGEKQKSLALKKLKVYLKQVVFHFEDIVVQV